MPFLLPFVAAAALVNSVFGTDVRISSASDLIQFSNNVNSGSTYYGTTVFLDSDLDFSGNTFESIGNSESNYFRGDFDGQGHVISNLAMTSSSQCVGLFGISYGLAIRNVILDSSCSITSSYESNANAYVGGIIGYCKSSSLWCTIENSMNMASVSFTGNTNDYFLTLGGIAGILSKFHEVAVKNCANYGDVTNSGKSTNSYIGGITGTSYGTSSYNKVDIYNSLNYGTITHKGSSNGLAIGGISGGTESTTIKGCLSTGNIDSTGTATSKYVGSIVGIIYSYTSIRYCYTTSELSSYNKYGDGTPSSESNVLSYDSTTFELSGSITFGDYTYTSLIDVLNSKDVYHDMPSYSHWLLNKDRRTVSFTINDRTAPISLSYQIILTPSLTYESSIKFDGWYEDSGHITPLTSHEVAEPTALYGLYGAIFAVAFDANGGESVSFSTKNVVLDSTYGELPEANRTGHTFAGWFTNQTGGEKVESESIVTISNDHTLYAQWTANKYTVTFNFNNGIGAETRTFGTGEAINYPEDPERKGFTFAGWSPKPETMPAEDITIEAEWTIENPSKCVEVMFTQDGLTKATAEEIIKGLVPEGTEFTIKKFDGINAVVKFIDSMDAASFVEAVDTSSSAKKNIGSANFIYEGCSFASSIGLSAFVFFLVYLFSF